MGIKREIIGMADMIADALNRGKDVEIRKCNDSIKVLEVEKHLIRRYNEGWDEVSK